VLVKKNIKNNLNDLEKSLNYVFKDRTLLNKALTHRSCGLVNNERLEFLGDSALNLAITFFLFNKKKDFTEGELHRLRANLVCEKTLSKVAINLSLSSHIILSSGLKNNGGNMRPSILSDSLEALLGAIFIDSGFDEVNEVIALIYQPILKKIDLNNSGKDPKSELQEILVRQKFNYPQYKVTSKSGADHDKTFRVKCSIPELKISSFGVGSSLKIAETSAALKIINDVKRRLKLI
jgi:ribonuclease-3